MIAAFHLKLATRFLELRSFFFLSVIVILLVFVIPEMSRDFGWERSAARYFELYRRVLERYVAMERNEIQFYAESSPSYRSIVEPGLVAQGRALPVWVGSMETPNGLVRHPDAEGIDAPTYEELLIRTKGEPPKGSMIYEAYRRTSATGTNFLRLYMMPPGAPKDAIDAVRDGLVAMSKDPEFREDAQKLMNVVPQVTVGPETEKAFRERLTANPEFIAFMRDYISKGHALSGAK